MVNSRSEYGVHFNSPKADVNHVYLDNDSLFQSKNQRNQLSKLEEKRQTKKPLPGGWVTRSSKTDQQKKNIGAHRDKENESGCCKNKSFKRNRKKFQKNNISRRKQFSKQSKQRPTSITLLTDDKDTTEGSYASLNNQNIMHNYYLNGSYNFWF